MRIWLEIPPRVEPRESRELVQTRCRSPCATGGISLTGKSESDPPGSPKTPWYREAPARAARDPDLPPWPKVPSKPPAGTCHERLSEQAVFHLHDLPFYGSRVLAVPSIGNLNSCRVPIYQIDAFASGLFKGNPAARLLLWERWLPDEMLQSIAAENNLAETAYYTPSGHGRFQLRWFTPKWKSTCVATQPWQPPQ